MTVVIVANLPESAAAVRSITCSAGTKPVPFASGSGWVAVASIMSSTSNPMSEARHVVVSTHCSVRMPQILSLVIPRCWSC